MCQICSVKQRHCSYHLGIVYTVMSLFMFTSLTAKSLCVCRVSCVGDGGYTSILVLNVASTITTERLSILTVMPRLLVQAITPHVV